MPCSLLPPASELFPVHSLILCPGFLLSSFHSSSRLHSNSSSREPSSPPSSPVGTTESFYFWFLYRIASLEPYLFFPRGTSAKTLALLTADQETEEGPTWQEPWKHLTETGKDLLTLSSQAQEGTHLCSLGF